MPKVKKSTFGTKERIDGKEGWREIIPTKMGYVEEDGLEVRVRRVKVFNSFGDLEMVYLQDEMGVPFKNLPDVEDDIDFLNTL